MKSLVKKDQKLLNKIKLDYQVKEYYYSHSRRSTVELERFNKKRGFYNTVCILDNSSPDTINEAILKDYYYQKSLNTKKANSKLEDDEI